MTSGFNGYFEGIRADGWATGWIHRTDGVGDKANVRVTIDGVEASQLPADQFREDLLAAAFSDPGCAFSYRIPDTFIDAAEHRIDVVFADTGASLLNSPQLFTLEPPPATAPAGIDPVADDGPVSPPQPEGEDPATSGFDGYFDGIRADGWATGWIHRTDGASGKARVLVTIDGVEVGLLPADQFREDLLAANFPDPGCAFLYRIPDDFIDAAEHRIDVAFADTGVSLLNSPQLFMLEPPVAAPPAGANLIPNADFARWPHGVSVTPSRRLQEAAEGWLVDFWRGISSGATFAVDRPSELALRPDEFALRISVPDPITGYLRLVVPLATETLVAGRYHVGFGLRRPPVGAHGDLHLANLFLAALDDETVTRVAGIRRDVRVRGTMRLHGIPLDLDEAKAALFGNGIQPALVFEFLGHGVVQMFEPDLSAVPRPRAVTPVGPGAFEDPNIAGQIKLLALSPHWAAHPAPPPALPAAPARRGSTGALPFVQIVVPVFNAGTDIDELVASIVEHGDSPFELLFTDDASGAFTEQRLQRWTARDPRIRLLRNEANLGYTRNINRALQSTVATHVVLLNSDTIVTEGWLGRLFDAMDAPGVAAVGPLSNAASWQSVPLARDSNGRWSSNPLTAGVSIARMASAVAALSEAAFPDFPLLNGFCTLFRRDALEAVGWFDDGTFPQGYGEENDLCLRLGQAGWRLRVADHAYVHHKKSRSFGPVRRAQLSRSATTALQAKHPAVVIPSLEAAMQGSEPINRLRSRLVATIRAEHAL